MITLKADNRILIRDAKFSFLETNYQAGVASINVLNSNGIQANSYILIGNIGSENAEILKVSAVTGDTITFKDELDVATITQNAHAESTRVTVLPYDTIRFYWSAEPSSPTPPQTDLNEPSFSDVIGLPSSTTTFYPIDVTSIYSTYSDEEHSTGYGWFQFHNTHTGIYSTNSNAIPYGGFSRDSSAEIIRNFFSMVSDQDAKLISYDDVYTWANEGYNKIRSELNLTNLENATSDKISLTIYGAQKEYLLPDDFSELISIVNNQNVTIYKIEVTDLDSYNGTDLRYYIRGKYIGFTPTPTEGTTYYYRYLTQSPDIQQFTDKILLPDGGYYLVMEWMLHRAYDKLSNTQKSMQHKTNFEAETQKLKISAKKRDNNLDSWGIATSALI